MITLLLTATMSHAFSIGNSRLVISKKEETDDKAVRKFEKTAHTAHNADAKQLHEDLQKAHNLLIGLQNHEKAYTKSGNPRQAARTADRIKRLRFAMTTIASTLSRLSKKPIVKHKKLESEVTPEKPATAAASAIRHEPVAPAREAEPRNPTVAAARDVEAAKSISIQTEAPAPSFEKIKDEFDAALTGKNRNARRAVTASFKTKFSGYDFHANGTVKEKASSPRE